MSNGKRSVTYRGHDGISLSGDAWGNPDGQPVLFLHGGGQTRHAWGGTAAELASKGWHAVSIDHRGHGDSDWSQDGIYSLDHYIADVGEVLKTFDRPPAVVGASLGGMTALVAQGESSRQLFSSVVLVDITPRVEPKGVSRILAFMTGWPDGFASLEEAGDAVASYVPGRERPKDLSGLKKNLRLGEDGRYRWHWDPNMLNSNTKSKIRDPERLLDAARNITIPALLVRGKLSDIVSEEGAAEFREAVPHAQYVDVAKAGHMVAGDQNDVFTRSILTFLDEVHP